MTSDDSHEILGPGGKVDQEQLYRLYERQSESDDEQPISVRFVLSRDLNKRLDKYLVDRIPFLSRTSLQRLIREEAVRINGRVPKASTRLRKGDEIVAILPPPPSTEIPAEEIPIDVIYEDEHLIVVNKQDDIIVHPARGNRSGTLINGLVWHFQHETEGSLSSVGEEFVRPGIVHRLDRHTTGVMVVAKTDVAHWRVARQFEERRTEKRYLAVVHGRMEPLADVIDLPLGKHMTQREKYAVRWDETGKPSTTIYRVRELYDQFSLVELELKTGRTHQIRVHLTHIGFPIVGDDLYGGKHLAVRDVANDVKKLSEAHGQCPWASPDEPLIERQALHAALLGFRHPITGESMQFQAPLSDDIRTLVRALRTFQNPRPTSVAGTTIDLDEMLR